MRNYWNVVDFMLVLCMLIEETGIWESSYLYAV
jgi:hypothetical protein